MIPIKKGFEADIDYNYQRMYVSGMMQLISHMLKAGSQVDDVIKAEVADMPEGFVFRMCVMPGELNLTMKKQDGALVNLTDYTDKPDLTMSFKHVTFAFLVFSFQEHTAQAYANERLVIDGDVPMSMKVVRCLNRLQTVILPKVVAKKAVKTYPDLEFIQKIQMTTKTYSQFLLNLVKER